MGFRYGAVFAIIRAEESTDLALSEFLRSACIETCRSRSALGMRGRLISAGLRSPAFCWTKQQGWVLRQAGLALVLARRQNKPRKMES